LENKRGKARGGKAGEGDMAQTMYTHVSKSKNIKIKERKINK
jgi:hypothetical protein